MTTEDTQAAGGPQGEGWAPRFSPVDRARRQPESGTPDQRLDPQRSACVLIGVSEYAQLAPLDSVLRSVRALEHALTDPSVWGVPKDRCWVVENPQSHSDLTNRIRDAAEKAEDTLIVYYVGHGLLNAHDDQLYLTLPQSRPAWRESSVPYQTLRNIFQDVSNKVPRRVVILDCCYSGRALEQMSGEVLTGPAFAIDGSYVLTSTPADRPGIAPHGAKYTAFTGEFIESLTCGIPERKGQHLLTLNQVYDTARKALADRGMPEPQRQDQNGVGDLLFVRNRAHLPPVRAPGPSRPKRTWWARWVVPGVVLVTVAGGSAVAGAWWERSQQGPPAPKASPATGPCGTKHVSLLDTSDALNKTTLHGEQVRGLSALALTDPSHALTIPDDDPGKIYYLSLGKPGKLAPKAEKVRGLYTADGTRYSQDFDAEGLVLEKGGKTVLVSTEGGPAIRRFRLEDGRQTGELPLPEEFRFPPEGQAQRSRNLESLTATEDGKYLFAGMEAPLAVDDDKHGRRGLRIQRYKGASGGDYKLDQQFAYETEEGHFLSELVALDQSHLLALERNGVYGLGHSVLVYRVDLSASEDVQGKESIGEGSADAYVHKTPLFDLAACPEGTTKAKRYQRNPILENAEGMALGPRLEGKEHEGRRVLYLISDDNGASDLTTRLYAFAVRLR